MSDLRATDEETIGSPDLQTAIDYFCSETLLFLIGQMPELENDIRKAMRHGQSLWDICYMANTCSKGLKPLASIISDWTVDVFLFQFIKRNADNKSEVPDSAQWFLSWERYTNIPYRIEAMRRLREHWSCYPAKAGIRYLQNHAVRVDMQDWINSVMEKVNAA